MWLSRGFVYREVLMDILSGCICGWQSGSGLGQELALTALRKALNNHRHEIHYSDQSLQHAASANTTLLLDHGAKLSMAKVDEPTQKDYANRLIRTDKDEEVDLSDYEDYHPAYAQTDQLLEEVYRCRRVHSRIGYLTPTEFESQW